jgi:hypothetical protein
LNREESRTVADTREAQVVYVVAWGVASPPAIEWPYTKSRGLVLNRVEVYDSKEKAEKVAKEVCGDWVACKVLPQGEVTGECELVERLLKKVRPPELPSGDE